MKMEEQKVGATDGLDKCYKENFQILFLLFDSCLTLLKSFSLLTNVTLKCSFFFKTSARNAVTVTNYAKYIETKLSVQ